MGRWLDMMLEPLFKRVPAGYVFSGPSPWIFVRKFYLVNEAQKADLITLLRRAQRLMLAVTVIWMVPFFAGLCYAASQNWDPFLTIGTATVVMLTALAVMPNLYLMRLLAPITDTLPRSDQRISQVEMLHKVAAAMPKWLLVTGLIGGAAIVVGSGISMTELAANNRLASRWMSEASAMLNGLLLTAFFGVLLRFKTKRQQVS